MALHPRKTKPEPFPELTQPEAGARVPEGPDVQRRGVWSQTNGLAITRKLGRRPRASGNREGAS